MTGPDKTTEEKEEEARIRAEEYAAKAQTTLQTGKSFFGWMLGIWAKFAIGCVVVVVILIFASCVVIQGMLR